MIALDLNITDPISAAIKELDPDALIGTIREGIYEALSEALSQQDPEEGIIQAIVDAVCSQVDTVFQKRHKDEDGSVLISTLRDRVMEVMNGDNYDDDELWIGFPEIFEDVFARLSVGEALSLSSSGEKRGRKKREAPEIIEHDDEIYSTPQSQEKREYSGSGYREDELGFYAGAARQTPLLTREEEVELAMRIARGDEQARTHMIKANLRLVMKIAGDFKIYGVLFEDLVQEGNIGLMKAVDRYDPSYGSKFSTYAAWWIKQSIKRALSNQSKTIRIPVHMVDKISKMRRVASVLSEGLGREPTDDEISDEIGIAAHKIAAMKSYAMNTASLNAPMSEDDSTEFGEIVADEKAQTPAEIVSLRDMHMQLEDLVGILDPRELQIISARYYELKTLEEVGQEFGVTRERIRQLQNIALRKMRRTLKKIEDPNPRAATLEETANLRTQESDHQVRIPSIDQFYIAQQESQGRAILGTITEEKIVSREEMARNRIQQQEAQKRNKEALREEKQLQTIQEREEKRIKKEQARELKIQLKRKEKAQKAPPFTFMAKLSDIQRRVTEWYYDWDGTNFNPENDRSFKVIPDELEMNTKSAYHHFLQARRILSLSEDSEDKEMRKRKQIEEKRTAQEARQTASTIKYFQAKREEAKTVRLFLEHLTEREMEFVAMFWGVCDDDVTCTIRHIAQTSGTPYSNINASISNIRKKIEKWSTMSSPFELPASRNSMTRIDVSKKEPRQSFHAAKKLPSIPSELAISPSIILPERQDSLIISLYSPQELHKLPQLADNLDMTLVELETRVRELGLDLLYTHTDELESNGATWISDELFAQSYEISIFWLQSRTTLSRLLHNEAASKALDSSKYSSMHLRGNTYSPHLQSLLLRAYKKQYPSYRIPEKLLEKKEEK